MTGIASPVRKRLARPLMAWSDTEKTYLQTHYRFLSWQAIQKEMPWRSKSAIIQQAGAQGLWRAKVTDHCTSWSTDELEILYQYYPDNGYDVCLAFMPARDANSIKLKAKRLKIKCKNTRPNKLSEQELNFITSNVARMGFVACADALHDTPDSLRVKCSKMGIDCAAIDLHFSGGLYKEGDFSNNEVSYIRDHYGAQGGIRVAQQLGRNPSTVINFASRNLKLSTQRPDYHPKYSVVNPYLADSTDVQGG